MADPIRKQILDAYVTALEAITTGNGYRQSLTTVDILAKDWAHHDMDVDSLPFAGVVPGDEVSVNLPFGYTEIEWPIQVVIHFQLQTRTDVGLVLECENVRTDVRRALGSTINLGVTGVQWIRVDGAMTAEASETAIEHSMGGVIVKTTVKFRESVGAT